MSDEMLRTNRESSENSPFIAIQVDNFEEKSNAKQNNSIRSFFSHERIIVAVIFLLLIISFAIYARNSSRAWEISRFDNSEESETISKLQKELEDLKKSIATSDTMNAVTEEQCKILEEKKRKEMMEKGFKENKGKLLIIVFVVSGFFVVTYGIAIYQCIKWMIRRRRGKAERSAQ